ncbi:MFS-type transporter involved in bile tolerance, Atg22 family [Desulfuromusa kysingii]|uniref:MFS-type transporter involved in bile tolerance, Atg22 family n=1 Tax=Desulfuromusa kysingii TaxID=37625 RepID=A0A1H4E183_9BACT|nr:MFS transporter [Desulfuromusa kysingii]SEA78320.1 MFS-type transporter involved in bile tolerance, Atg22 family [Desulfuromusa kysingii]
MMSSKEHLSGILSNDDDLDRACRSIPKESCQEASKNFTINVCNGAASKLAEQVAGPNLILPWLFQLLGTPVWMFGFLMPIKQSFSLLPQMVVAGQIRKLALRKWVWVVAAMVQALCLLLMVPVALWLSPVSAGFSLLGLLVVFSTASGAASVAFQDVLGKTIDKGRRGRLLARRALVGGLLTTAVGLLLNRYREVEQGLSAVLVLLFAAAMLWGLAALFFALIREFPGAVKGGRNAFLELRSGLSLFRQYPGFRRFLLARSLLLSVELATPFFVLHAGQLLHLKIQSIGSLMVAVGVSQVLSSPFWGKMADQTSKRVMALSSFIAFVAAMLAIALTFISTYSLQYAGYLLVFMLVGLAEAGVRLGRKTYLVDAAPAEERATYTAFSNSFVGVIAMMSGITGLVAQWLGASVMISVIAVFMLLGYWACKRMPEADVMLRR